METINGTENARISPPLEAPRKRSPAEHVMDALSNQRNQALGALALETANRTALEEHLNEAQARIAELEGQLAAAASAKSPHQRRR